MSCELSVSVKKTLTEKKSEDDEMKEKYHEIWENIKIKLNIKFHSMLAYDETCIKAKARKFSDVFETNFLGGEAPKENIQ